MYFMPVAIMTYVLLKTNAEILWNLNYSVVHIVIVIIVNENATPQTQP